MTANTILSSKINKSDCTTQENSLFFPFSSLCQNFIGVKCKTAGLSPNTAELYEIWSRKWVGGEMLGSGVWLGVLGMLWVCVATARAGVWSVINGMSWSSRWAMSEPVKHPMRRRSSSVSLQAKTGVRSLLDGLLLVMTHILLYVLLSPKTETNYYNINV